MPMREDCKFFESRSYASGDTVRKCDLNLAPEAPWRCPDDCQAYTRRIADVNWSYGSLVTPPPPEAPASLGEDESIAALLGEAEEIVRQAGPSVMADLEAERSKRRGRGSSSKRRKLRRDNTGKATKPSKGPNGPGRPTKPGASRPNTGDGGPLGRLGKFLRDQRNKDQ